MEPVPSISSCVCGLSSEPGSRQPGRTQDGPCWQRHAVEDNGVFHFVMFVLGCGSREVEVGV